MPDSYDELFNKYVLRASMCQVFFKILEFISEQNKESPHRALDVKSTLSIVSFLHLSPTFVHERETLEWKACRFLAERRW